MDVELKAQGCCRLKVVTGLVYCLAGLRTVATQSQPIYENTGYWPCREGLINELLGFSSFNAFLIEASNGLHLLMMTDLPINERRCSQSRGINFALFMSL